MQMSGFRVAYLFGADQDESVRLRNFYPPEDRFAWTAGRWSEIEFPLDLPADAQPAHVWFSIELDAFRRPPALAGQDVFIYVNGWRAASLHVMDRQVVHFRVRGSLLEADANVVTFDLPDAARPSEFGEADERQLGVQIYSLAIEGADAPELATEAPGAY
jgi:hypothetical protein